jgi:hypothetical protein
MTLLQHQGSTRFHAESVINNFTNLTDINRVLHETLAKERTIDLELEKLLGKRGELESKFLSLHASTSELVRAGLLGSSVYSLFGVREGENLLRGRGNMDNLCL